MTRAEKERRSEYEALVFNLGSHIGPTNERGNLLSRHQQRLRSRDQFTSHAQRNPASRAKAGPRHLFDWRGRKFFRLGICRPTGFPREMASAEHHESDQLAAILFRHHLATSAATILSRVAAGPGERGSLPGPAWHGSGA